MRRLSFFAFATMCLYLFVAKAKGNEALAGLLFALPNLLLTFIPASRTSITRGIALIQGFIFGGISALGLLLGLSLRSTDVLLYLLFPIFVAQSLLFFSAAKREPSEAAEKGGPASETVLLSGFFTLIFLACVFELVLQQ